MNIFYLLFIVSCTLPITAARTEISPQEVRSSTSTQPTITYQQDALENPIDNIIENFEKIKNSKQEKFIQFIIQQMNTQDIMTENFSPKEIRYIIQADTRLISDEQYAILQKAFLSAGASKTDNFKKTLAAVTAHARSRREERKCNNFCCWLFCPFLMLCCQDDFINAGIVEK